MPMFLVDIQLLQTNSDTIFLQVLYLRLYNNSVTAPISL